MAISERIIEQLIYRQHQKALRFTQDSPVYPDVWLEYARHTHELFEYRADLILTAHHKSSAGELFQALITALRESNSNRFENMPYDIACTGDTVVAKLTFYELISIALPMTKWWQEYLWKNGKPTPHLEWLKQLAGALLYDAGRKGSAESYLDIPFLLPVFEEIANEYFQFRHKSNDRKDFRPLWSVSRNREAGVAIEKSVPATKADASRRVFDIDGAGITWAMFDSGIDARHDAFRKKDADGKPFAEPLGAVSDPLSNHTRIAATYDFTRFREALVSIHKEGAINRTGKKNHVHTTSSKDDRSLSIDDIETYESDIKKALSSGRVIDWSAIAPLLRIPHNKTEYIPPVHPHGTHVAGILGACLEDKKNPDATLLGMCPGIELYDIRVMDEEGKGDEFNILAALQFVRWLNNQKDQLVIHGANMSFSMVHQVASYACGQTPVCDAAEKMVSEGMVVVAAAGNQGQSLFQSTSGTAEQGFRMVNITDPGNADAVITVGATHRNQPHSYGVSYFSSKGPTGDGRVKPDLVAPGEKIVSTVPDNATDRMDGSSMAAPHVSGAAALLMCKHRELIGRPKKIKAILCETATDLGREKYFQGSGMIDVLRAIQSV